MSRNQYRRSLAIRETSAHPIREISHQERMLWLSEFSIRKEELKGMQRERVFLQTHSFCGAVSIIF